MPFDNTNYVETAPQHAEEIAILDKMAEILATPERWCRKHLIRTEDGVTATQFCIVGALHAASFNTYNAETILKQEWADIQKKIWAALKPEGFESVPQFNDAPDTTHQDILDLISRTRASFS